MSRRRDRTVPVVVRSARIFVRFRQMGVNKLCSVTDVSRSRASLAVNATHISIQIETGRTSGGDAWVASSKGASGEVQRALAWDHRNGSYSAHLRRTAATDVRLQLWWSASSPEYLERQWVQLLNASTLAQKSFGCDCARCCCRVECKAVPFERWTVPPLEVPRSVSAPRQSTRARCAPTTLVLGDSVSNGFVLDMCAHASCAVNNVGPAKATFRSMPIMARPVRRGLLNLVTQASLWERFILNATHLDTVVLQSGIHDVSHPLRKRRRLPLQQYSDHLKKVRDWILRIRGQRPRLRFVWRMTTYALLMDHDTQRNSQACARRAFPTTHPVVVQRLNTYARLHLGDVAELWTEPASLSRDASTRMFSDAVHHDACGAGSDRVSFDTSAGSRCASNRIVKGSVPTRFDGALSEKISHTFFLHACDPPYGRPLAGERGAPRWRRAGV